MTGNGGQFAPVACSEAQVEIAAGTSSIYPDGSPRVVGRVNADAETEGLLDYTGGGVGSDMDGIRRDYREAISENLPDGFRLVVNEVHSDHAWGDEEVTGALQRAEEAASEQLNDIIARHDVDIETRDRSND